MGILIQQHSTIVFDSDTAYSPLIMGTKRTDGTWEGWIEFQPVAPSGDIRRTSRETTQPNREALAYWASGLEPVYFEGAFERAIATGRQRQSSVG